MKHSLLKLILSSAVVLTSSAAMAQNKASLYNANITLDEVTAAQQGWGKALVQISDDYAKGGITLARASAAAIIDAAYGYNMGPVLFKPTLASGAQTFRTTKEGALAYFVGSDSNYPKDTGFGIKGWKKVVIENAGIHINGDVATTMGNVIFTDKDGKITTVDKTWMFKKDDSGKIRITLHHSSLPYAGN
jgi:hypothetical protein